VKNAKARNFESDFRAPQEARRIGLAKKVARRVAVVAAADRHEILAPFKLALLRGRRFDERNHEYCRGKSRDDKIADHFAHSHSSVLAD
jgi:hypothetical protein